MNKPNPFLFLCLLGTTLFAQTKPAQSDFVLARLKYYGGGDWYNDPSSIPNLLQFMTDNSNYLELISLKFLGYAYLYSYFMQEANEVK